MAEVLYPAILILALSLFLDLLDLSFGRITWFIKTARFWLYFILHFGLSCGAAYLIRTAVPVWYLQALAGTFLGVAVISNTDIKIAGYSLLPVAQLFLSVRAKMFEQAAEDKATEVAKAQLVERLQNVPLAKIKAAHSAALIAAGHSAQSVVASVDRALRRCGGNEQCVKNALIVDLLRTNYDFARQNIQAWEQA
jgi:hypothetical protein